MLCGHFNTHWTVLYYEEIVESRQYCTDCRQGIRTILGAAAAEHMQWKTRASRDTPTVANTD
jgi:hypothetical protein